MKINGSYIMNMVSINNMSFIEYENYTFGYNPIQNQFSAISSLPFCNLTKRTEENKKRLFAK